MSTVPRVNIFLPTQPSDHVNHLTALADGIPGANLIPIEAGYVACDIAVVFGVGKREVIAAHPRGAIIYEHHFRRRKPVVIVERGFVDREQYYGVAINGLNGMGDFFNEDSPSDRWDALKRPIKSWRETDKDKYILVCGQVPWDASVQHTNHPAWCRETVETIRGMTDRPVRFRPHPLTKSFDYGIEASQNTFEEDMVGAHAIVTFSSTTSCLAVLEGIPIFCMDKGSMAYDICNRILDPGFLELPVLYDRDQWAHNLAYAQWNVEEMRSGVVWDRLKKRLETLAT